MIWPKRLLHLVLGCLLLVLARRLGLPWSLTLVAVVVPLIGVEALLRRLVDRHGRRFEQQLVALLQAGRNDELLPLYRGQLLLRFAAPRHLTLGKLGLIHGRLGQHRHAVAAYREALIDVGPEGNYTLSLGLAASLYELGEDQEAEKLYRSLITDDRINVQACARLSRLIFRRGGDPAEAERLLRMAVDAARGGALRCELALFLVEQGRPDEARQQLLQAEQELSDSTDEEDRAALERVRARLSQD